MPFDSEGQFTRVHNWEDDRINGISIDSNRMDEELDDVVGGLSESVLRDGRAAMTGDLNMAAFKIRNLKDGTSATDAVNKAQSESFSTKVAKEIVSGTVFVGDIKQSLQPENHGVWLLCDGQEVSRSEYADLFAVIGTNFGAGDGANTFNVPDYRGKFLRGLGGDSAPDFQTTQSEGLPNITGTWNPNSIDGANAATGAFENTSRYSVGTGHSPGQTTGFNFDASRSSAIYGASEHVTPINQAVNYFIKAKSEG